MEIFRISTYKGSFHSGKRSWTTWTWIKDNTSNMNRLIIENRIVLIYFFNKFWINIGATIWKYVEYHWLTWFLFQIFTKILYCFKKTCMKIFPLASCFKMIAETSALRPGTKNWRKKFLVSITLIVVQFISFQSFEYLFKYFIWDPNHPKHNSFNAKSPNKTYPIGWFADSFLPFGPSRCEHHPFLKIE